MTLSEDQIILMYALRRKESIVNVDYITVLFFFGLRVPFVC